MSITAKIRNDFWLLALLAVGSIMAGMLAFLLMQAWQHDAPTSVLGSEPALHSTDVDDTSNG